MTATTILGQLPTVLSVPRKAVIEGVVEYEGDVIVEGSIVGDVRCRTLTIKERGQVDGSIVAERVIVLGEASGEIYASDLVLRTACSVAADIFHSQLLLEDGCYFEGRSRRCADPVSLAS